MRTADCDACGTTGLRRETYPSGEFRLFNRETGEPHVCDGTAPVSVNGASDTLAVATLKDRVDSLSRAMTQVGTDLSNVAARVDGNGNGHIDRDAVLDIVHAENASIRESLSDLTGAAVTAASGLIRSQVREIVAAMVPTTHEIRILDKDGTELRRIGGRPHRKVRLLVQFASLRRNLMMFGGAGGGKTTAGRQVAEALALPFYSLALGPSHDEWSLMGFMNAAGTYTPGFFREPYEHGGVVLLDELDNARAEVVTALNNLMENGHARFPDGVDVARHPDFVLLVGANTVGKGGNRVYLRNQLDGASMNRLAKVEFDYDEEAEFEWAGTDQREWVEYVQKVRHAVDKLEMRHIVSPRQSVNGAVCLRGGMEREDVEEAYLWADIPPDDKMRILANVEG